MDQGMEVIQARVQDVCADGFFSVFTCPCSMAEPKHETSVCKIMKPPDERFILAWHFNWYLSLHTLSLLADSPDYFANCDDVHWIPSDQSLKYCTKHFYPGVISSSASSQYVEASEPLHLCGHDNLNYPMHFQPAGSKYVVNLDGADVISRKRRTSL